MGMILMYVNVSVLNTFWKNFKNDLQQKANKDESPYPFYRWWINFRDKMQYAQSEKIGPAESQQHFQKPLTQFFEKKNPHATEKDGKK